LQPRGGRAREILARKPGSFPDEGPSALSVMCARCEAAST
jgi:hypothetical protein